MKKILVLLLLSSPLLTMELSYKRHTQHSQLAHITSSLIKTHKPNDFYRTSRDNASIISHEMDKEKVLIEASSIRAPHSLSDAKLYHTNEGFVVQYADKQHVIEKRFMDPIARTIKKEEVRSFLKLGFFALNQTNDGTFTLKAHYRLRGGGPLFGKFMYWATKVTCYSVLIAGTGAIVFGGGGSVGIGVAKGAKGLKIIATTAKAAKAAHATATVAESIKIATVMTQTAAGAYIGNAGAVATVTQASGTAIFTPTVVTGGMATSGVIASGIIKAGGAPVCAKVTGAALATGTSGSGIVAGIEALSLAVGLFFGLTPTP